MSVLVFGFGNNALPCQFSQFLFEVMKVLEQPGGDPLQLKQKSLQRQKP